MKTVKLTKAQLRQIIKEELDATMREPAPPVFKGAEEISDKEVPRARSWKDEDDVIHTIRQQVGDQIEVVESDMSNWDTSKDQIVYMGSVKGRGGQKVAYFKTSNTHHYYRLPIAPDAKVDWAQVDPMQALRWGKDIVKVADWDASGDGDMVTVWHNGEMKSVSKSKLSPL